MTLETGADLHNRLVSRDCNSGGRYTLISEERNSSNSATTPQGGLR